MGVALSRVLNESRVTSFPQWLLCGAMHYASPCKICFLPQWAQRHRVHRQNARLTQCERRLRAGLSPGTRRTILRCHVMQCNVTSASFRTPVTSHVAGATSALRALGAAWEFSVSLWTLVSLCSPTKKGPGVLNFQLPPESNLPFGACKIVQTKNKGVFQS